MNTMRGRLDYLPVTGLFVARPEVRMRLKIGPVASQKRYL